MKKFPVILGAAFAIMLLVASFFVIAPAPVSADSPTTITVIWSGSGTTSGSVVAGTASNASFYTGGSIINGNFSATDYNDNPYTYGVDTTKSYIQSAVTNGSSWYIANRTGSYSPMYGPAGQGALSFITSSGTAEMATGSGSNYAAMGNGTYGLPHTSGGYNYQADAMGGSYQIISYITSNGAPSVSGATIIMPTTGDYAMLNSTGIGAGTVKINDMTNEASGTSLVNFGLGGGCYTNANAIATGPGIFTVIGSGTNQVATAGGWTAGGNGTVGSAYVNTTATFNNGASVTDYSVTVR